MKKIFLTILFFCVIVNFCYAKIFEEQLNHDQSLMSIYEKDWSAQTFTTISSHNIYGIKLWLRVSQTRNKDLTIYLCDTLDEMPIWDCVPDNYLSKEIFNTQTINPLISGIKEHIIFASSSNDLTENQLYALVITNENATTGTLINLWGSNNNLYEFGKMWYTEEGNWQPAEESDLYFQIIGELPCPATSEDMCVCTTTLDYISNTTTGAGFWLDSSISFGDFLIASFLLGILIIFTIQFIFHLEIPKRIYSKKI